MKNSVQILLIASAVWFGANANVLAHDEVNPATSTRSQPGSNVWNQAHEPTNWWNEIKQAHGHVGPWNVVGWRIGKAALREFNVHWGEHELDVVCHVPLAMPFSCTADGLVIGTGNSIGRLDLRLAEEPSIEGIHVTVRRKDGAGPVLIFKPAAAYLEKIRSRPASELHALAVECGELPESELFAMERAPVPK